MSPDMNGIRPSKFYVPLIPSHVQMKQYEAPPWLMVAKYVVAVSGSHVYRLVSAVRLRAERGKRRIIYIKSLQASLDPIQNSVDLMKNIIWGPIKQH